jgi:adenosylmethionine-8-amino-7-oxononanoate aminotransferase
MPRDSNFLKEHNARHMWHPMAHPAEMIAHPPKIIAHAEGVTLTDIDGHKVIDAVGGLWNVNLGFSCQPIKDAIAAQLNALPYYSAFRGTTHGPAIELAHALAEFFAPEGLVRSFFTSGGGDAVDTALRLARQYHKLRGEKDRIKFLSLKKGYHGTHWGGASVNGNANFRRNYEPLLPGCFHIPCPYTYRNPFNEADPARLAQLCAAALEDEIAFQGADTIAAFIMEPTLGAGGVIPPHESFLPMVREICTRHGILLIADEVITGFGRSGSWTGCRGVGVQPDMLCFAKAITNGYFPFGGVMVSAAVAEVFEKDETTFGMIGHGYTYSAHPVGAAAALATLPELQRHDVASNAAARGAQLLPLLMALKDRFDIVGDVRGRGLMLGVEIVSDRAKKTPMDKTTMGRIFEGAWAHGVMLRISGHNILMSPPLIITPAEAARIASGVEAGLAAA